MKMESWQKKLHDEMFRALFELYVTHGITPNLRRLKRAMRDGADFQLYFKVLFEDLEDLTENLKELQYTTSITAEEYWKRRRNRGPRPAKDGMQ